MVTPAHFVKHDAKKGNSENYPTNDVGIRFIPDDPFLEDF
jgi:hypothetical protein